ncbi:MAG: hypothetical protein FJ220_02895, partial [Kiritimatiellaceae bacterium]|nr:hypothetical protein [Kiritimatiellaceae bacterium]
MKHGERGAPHPPRATSGARKRPSFLNQAQDNQSLILYTLFFICRSLQIKISRISEALRKDSVIEVRPAYTYSFPVISWVRFIIIHGKHSDSKMFSLRMAGQIRNESLMIIHKLINTDMKRCEKWLRESFISMVLVVAIVLPHGLFAKSDDRVSTFVKAAVFKRIAETFTAQMTNNRYVIVDQDAEKINRILKDNQVTGCVVREKVSEGEVFDAYITVKLRSLSGEGRCGSHVDIGKYKDMFLSEPSSVAIDIDYVLFDPDSGDVFNSVRCLGSGKKVQIEDKNVTVLLYSTLSKEDFIGSDNPAGAFWYLDENMEVIDALKERLSEANIRQYTICAEQNSIPCYSTS